VIFDPKQASWSAMPDLPQGRWSAQAALLPDGSVLVVGGVVASNPRKYATTAERFFP